MTETFVVKTAEHALGDAVRLDRSIDAKSARTASGFCQMFKLAKSNRKKGRPLLYMIV